MPEFDSMKMYEALSAMQKSIRRSMEREAGYWFWWLCENSFAGAALGRLKVTAYEDIGAGDVGITMAAVKAIEDAQAWLKAKNDAWRLPATFALLLLARAPKSRETDHCQAAIRAEVLRDMKAGAVRETPDWALDKHTARGRRMRRGIEHFRTDGAKLIPVPPTDEYEAEAYRAWEMPGALTATPVAEATLFE